FSSRFFGISHPGTKVLNRSRIARSNTGCKDLKRSWSQEFTRDSTESSIFPTNTRLALAATVVPRLKFPFAMYCFINWNISRSRTTTPSPTSWKATTSQNPITPTCFLCAFQNSVAADVGARIRVAYGENSLKLYDFPLPLV